MSKQRHFDVKMTSFSCYDDVIITSYVRLEGDIPVHQLQSTRKPYTYSQNNRGLCNVGYTSETHFKIKSWEISFVHNIRFSCPIGLKFCAQSTAVILPWSVQSFKTFDQLRHGLRANKISQDLCSRCVSSQFNWPRILDQLRTNRYVLRQYYQIDLLFWRRRGNTMSYSYFARRKTEHIYPVISNKNRVHRFTNTSLAVNVCWIT